MFKFRRAAAGFSAASLAPEKGYITISHEGTDKIEFSNLTLRRPRSSGGETLIEPFNLTLKLGDRLMITGASGSGKSTLLRAVSGLWRHGEGNIALPSGMKVLCVPQKPYLPLVPLKEIICYPENPSKFEDKAIEDALRAVGMEQLIGNLNDKQHEGNYWSQRLSLGEQQKLVFARIILHKPDILMLDEVTASLDPAAEVKLYEQMVKSLPNSLIISVSHRQGIIPFHTVHAKVADKKISFESLKPANDDKPAPPKPA